MTDRPHVEGIYIGSGISTRTGEPFCHVTVQLVDGTFSEAQLDPATVRRMAFDWIEAAEAAIHDAAVYHLLTGERVGMPAAGAASFVADLREYRADADRMVDVPDDEGSAES